MSDSNLPKFRGSLGEYELRMTSDGSPTLFSQAFNEACHSNHGASEETRYIYVEGCEVVPRKLHSILEIGFGLGTGWKETVAVHDNFRFYSTELDEKLVHWAAKEFELFDSLIKKNDHLIGKKKNSECVILLGDARKTVPNFDFDFPIQAIYQDAFSPKRNPSLWTVEWFEDLKKVSSDEVILSTYSASSRVKKALFCAGWIVEERKGFSLKRSSTRAFQNGEINAQVLEKLQNEKITPMRDSELT